MNADTRKWILMVTGLIVVAFAIAMAIITVACAAPSKPIVKINSPASGIQLTAGQMLAVNSTMTDNLGVVRVELLVDNGIARVDDVPAPQKAYTLEQTWQAMAGQHVLSVRAYNTKGIGSEPAVISVNVLATPTPLPLPTTVAPTAAPACAPQAAFIADVTTPPGTSIAPNQSFNKTWRVQNTGACGWNNNFQFIYVGGESMSSVQMISVPYTAPNATADLVIAMVAPASPGLHIGQWQLRDDKGAFFGPLLEARINVAGATPTATAVPSFAVTGATATASPAIFAGNCPGTFAFAGAVTTNRAGTLAYRWIIPGTAPSDTLTFNAPNAGTFNLPAYSANISNKGGLWGQLQIVSPNALASNQAAFVNNCLDPKPAPPQAVILQPGSGFTGQAGQAVRVVFQGNGNTELSSVSLYANGALLSKQSSRTPSRQIQAAFDWTPNAAGSYDLYAVAVDIFGQQTTSPHVNGFIYQPAPQPTPVPPPTPMPQPTPAPQRRDINGNWSAGEWTLELAEAMGCSSAECGIAGTLTHAVLPMPETNPVRGTLNVFTGAVTFAVEMPGGRSFTGTLSANSRTLAGNLSGVGSLTFTKQ